MIAYALSLSFETRKCETRRQQREVNAMFEFEHWRAMAVIQRQYEERMNELGALMHGSYENFMGHLDIQQTIKKSRNDNEPNIVIDDAVSTEGPRE